MTSLVVCRCRHDIVAHEGGRCETPGCTCRNSRSAILDDEIDRLKLEHSMKSAASHQGIR
jgi:hypothetical protein